MIPSKYTYLLVDMGCLLFPLLFSFHPRFFFKKQWRFFFLPCVLTAVFFIAWDILFTARGVWQFNPHYVLGLYIFNLPLEEVLFFLCIPYACVFTYYCVTLYFNRILFRPWMNWFTILLALALLVLAVLNVGRLYTSITFLLLSALLIYIVAMQQKWLGTFYLAYLFILVPFFVSNGILTGTGPDQPVVIYNNIYNLGIRMLTIPLEDTFYGMLLLLLNVGGFEYLKNRKVDV